MWADFLQRTPPFGGLFSDVIAGSPCLCETILTGGDDLRARDPDMWVCGVVGWGV